MITILSNKVKICNKYLN